MDINFCKSSSFFGTFQNTWRNFLVVAVLGSSGIFGAMYVVYTRLYIDVNVSENHTARAIITTQKTAVKVRGVKEYASHLIGGDVSFDPPFSIPEKREMFVPFDTRLISAVGVMVKDIGTGQVLFAQNEYTPRSLASVTKLMAALTIEEYVSDWEKTTTSSPDTIFDSHILSDEVETLTHWYVVGLVGSSNRAILTLVDATGKTREEFIARMNEKAKELGMADTVFTDPTGIDPGNISTASDAGLLLGEALRNQRIVDTLSVHSVDHYSTVTKKTKTIWNTNWLLTDWIQSPFAEAVIGKTGYILESNYNFVGRFTKDSERSILVIVLGSNNEESRFTDARALAEWSFSNYEWRR